MFALRLRRVQLERDDSASMTRPKKWYMDDYDEPVKGIVLRNADGLLKKPNASQPLGCISEVTFADLDSSKYPQSLMVIIIHFKVLYAVLGAKCSYEASCNHILLLVCPVVWFSVQM